MTGFDLTRFRRASEAVNELMTRYPELSGDPEGYEYVASVLEMELSDDPLRPLVISELLVRAEFMREQRPELG